MTDPWVWLFAAIGVAVGAGVQGMMGFGAGIIAVPIMVAGGLSLPIAVGVIVGGGGVQIVWSTWRTRRDPGWWPPIRLSIWRAPGMAVGIALMTLIDRLGRGPTEQVLGVAILIALGFQLAAPQTEGRRAGTAATAGAGLASGVMAGAVGMGGPPMVLWALMHDWSARQMRVALWRTFCVSIPLYVAMLIAPFGWPLVVALAAGVALAPVAIGANELGYRLGERMSAKRMRTYASIGVAVIAVLAIVKPLLDGGGQVPG